MLPAVNVVVAHGDPQRLVAAVLGPPLTQALLQRGRGWKANQNNLVFSVKISLTMVEVSGQHEPRPVPPVRPPDLACSEQVQRLLLVPVQQVVLDMVKD